MNTSHFNVPDHHPFDMLRGYTNASEKEATLAVVLKSAIEKGNLLAPIKTKYNHPDMVTDGLLDQIDDLTYKLTRKAIGLLYTAYGKEDDPNDVLGG